MSRITEKVSYLKGLADGMELANEKEGKLLHAIIDVLDEISVEMEEMDGNIEDLTDEIDDANEAIDLLSDIIVDEDDEDDDEDFDLDDDDDIALSDMDDEDLDFLEVVCPACGDTIYFDEDMIDSEKGLICPNCNEPIEFNIINGVAEEPVAVEE